MTAFLKIPNSREPMFATASHRYRNGVMLYFDKDGMPACVDHEPRPNAAHCIICHNAVIMFHSNEDDTVTCSACGKFPRELLQS